MTKLIELMDKKKIAFKLLRLLFLLIPFKNILMKHPAASDQYYCQNFVTMRLEETLRTQLRLSETSRFLITLLLYLDVHSTE